MKKAQSLTYRFSCIALAMWLLGCGGAPLRATSQPPQGVDPANFGGRWLLDRQASDDVRARFIPLFEKDDKRWRRNAERFEEYQPRETERSPTDDEGRSNIRWMQRERQKESNALLAYAAPATQLDIQASAREVKIVNNKGEGTRTFVPGESTALFVAIGGFIVTSGWQKTGFQVYSRGEGENKAQITEIYQVVGGGAQLEEQLIVRFPGFGKQAFRIVYKRG